MRRQIPLLAALMIPLMGAQCPAKGDMDCKAEWAYDGREIETEINATKYGSVKFGTSKQAIREIDDRVGHYAVEWGRLCREFNAGAIDQAGYSRRSEAISDKLGRLDELLLVMANAPSEAAYLESLRMAYGVMAEDNAAVELEVQLAVMAKRPVDADYAVVAPNATLPTGTKVQLGLTTTASAYLYIYQVDAQGAIVPLFPDPRIPVTNPVAGGSNLRIPSGEASFTLNANDIGTEQVHVVASMTAMADLQASLGQASSDPTGTTAQQLDCAGARGLEYDSGSCPKSRGLVYDDGGGSSGYSVKAVNEAADDTVHLVYSFEHSAG